jgi:hypothetical protein
MPEGKGYPQRASKNAPKARLHTNPHVSGTINGHPDDLGAVEMAFARAKRRLGLSDNRVTLTAGQKAHVG